MLYKRSNLSLAIGLVIGTVVFTTATNAAEQVEKLQKVKVTGSHIATTDIEGPNPVDVYTAQDIKDMGASDVGDVLRGLTQNGGGSYGSSFTNGFAPGSAGVSMRGLGQARTLVLLNGRRVANYAFAQNSNETFVDLNSIPLSAVERIDVLKDGASAIYGSDAIGGVINLITKKDYDGFDFDLKGGQTSHGDGENVDMTVTAGKNFNDGKTNIMVSTNYVHKSQIKAKDRSNTKSANATSRGGDDWRSSFAPGGRVYANDDGDDLGCANGASECLYDFAEYAQIEPETEHFSILSSLNHQITDDVTLTTELAYNRVNTKTTAAPTPNSELTVIDASNPNNTYGEDVFIRNRIMEAGPRKNEITTDSIRFVTGLEGYANVFDTDVDWTVSAGYHYTETKSEGSNYLTVDGYEAAVASGAYNPFSSSNSRSSLAGALTDTLRKGKSKLGFINADASFPIVALPAGDLQMALGTEFRYEAGEDVPDAQSAAGNIIGSGATGSDGHRTVVAAYSELQIPVHDTVEAQLALRGEHYSDFGNAVSPKIGLRYQPSDIIMFRTSYSEGFKAPTLPEVNSGVTRAYETVDDGTNGRTEVEVRQGGNKDLEAEHSYSFNFGTVINPIENLTLKVDYFKITNTGMIDTRGTQSIVDGNGSGVHRNVDGTIDYVDNQYVNLNKQMVRGVDTEIGYLLPTASAGEFKFKVQGTYTIDHKITDPDTGTFDQYIGTYYAGPRFKGKASVVWSVSDYKLVNTVNYTGSYGQLYETDSVKDVDSWTTWDTQLSYSGFKNLVLTVGVDNVLDELAPFYNYSNLYNFEFSDNIGRYYYAGLSYSI